MTATLITAAALATELGTDARTARKFLRSITPKDDQPGKGSRWGIKGTKTEIARLRKAFTTFTAEQDAARAARDAKNAERDADRAAEATTDDAPADDDEGPSDAELEMIESGTESDD